MNNSLNIRKSNALLFNSVIFICLLLSLNIGLVYFTTNNEDVAFFKWSWIAIYTLILLYIYNDRQYIVKQLGNECLIIFILMLYVTISIFWSVSPSTTFMRVVGLIIPTIFAISLSNKITINKLKNGFYLLSIFICTISILTILFAPSIGIEQSHHAGLWRGAFHQKNLLGRFFCFVLIFFYFSNKYLKKNMLSLFMMVASTVIIIKSGSATALLVSVFCIVLTNLLMIRKRVKQYRIATFLIIFISVVILLLFLLNIQTIFENLGKDTTFSGRTIIWPKVLEMLDRVFYTGFGYGAFWVNGTITKFETASYFAWEVNHAHNGYIELLLDTGLIGLILFLSLVVLYIKRIANIMTNTREGKFLSSLATGYLIFFILMNITQILVLKQNAFYWCFFCFMYALMGHSQTKDIRE